MTRMDERQALIDAGAARLAEEAFAAVRFEDIARDAGIEEQAARGVFRSKTELASAILDHERLSMRTAMAEVVTQDAPPLEKLVQAFGRVGQNCADDVVVRAGVRLAAESRRYFPERRLDPFETWRAFVTAQLVHARCDGTLRDGIDTDDAVWLFVSAGIGAKDLIGFHDSWDRAGTQMAGTARTLVRMVSTEMAAR